MAHRILVVDDNVRLYRSLSQNFESEHFETLWAHDGHEAKALLASGGVSAVLLDIMVGAENGVSILADLRSIDGSVPVIMITGYASVETAVQSLKLGAVDYVKKPLDFDRLLALIQRAIEMSALKRENRDLKTRLKELQPRIYVRNRAMVDILDRVRKLGPTDLPVLIVGESGTGKELIADAIHSASLRSTMPMLKINCAAFPETLLDNELFGHERGAYTGAESVFKGIFERADRSSLFLDEISDMPLSIQAKILRTLQNNELRRIGGGSTFSIDVRFIAATNRDPQDLVREGKFREDLYYRLNTAVIIVPPLRERMDDLSDLATLFAEDYAAANSTAPRRISESVMQLFERYDWPGNVRELRNTINYACAVSNDEEIVASDLPPSFPRDRDHLSQLNVRDLAEKDLIVRTLHKLGNNKKRAAEVLDMSRRTLYNKLTKYGISSPPQ